MTDHLPPDSPRSGPSLATEWASGAASESHWERAALERIVSDIVREQRAARRWRIFSRLALLFFAAVAAWQWFISDQLTASSPHTALVRLNGEIASDTEASAENINTALEAAFDDKYAVGVILRINSPGGSPVQAGIINAKIRRLRSQYPDKPIYTVVDDICASGGYYVAVATNKIFVDKASLIGSIGVLMDGFGFTGLMNKLGIERRKLTAGENKGFFDPFSPETDKQKAHAQQILDEVHQQFISAVRQGRGKRLREEAGIFSGLFWNGEKGVELGLADGFGDTDYVSREVIKATDVVDYTVKQSLTERVTRKFGTAVGQAAMRSLLLGEKWQMR